MNIFHRLKDRIKKFLRFLNFSDIIILLIRRKITEVDYNNKKYSFYTPNSVCSWRAKTFQTKEPETIDWIDNFGYESVFWDIGANIGLYSIYASKNKKCKVFAFEPSVFNLEILAKNISLNKLSDKITIMPFPLNDKMGEGVLNMSSDEYGGAMSSFDKTYGSDGKEFDVIFSYSMFSFSLDDMVEKLYLNYPDYIKIDVDGIEHIILTGGTKILSNVKGLLIELPNLWEDQKLSCEKILRDSGLELVRDSEWDIKINPKGSPNQIWQRKK